MSHHFVVQKIVTGAQHNVAVDRHQMAEGLGGVDRDALVGALRFVERALELEGEGGTRRRVDLGKPGLIQRHVEPFLVEERH